MVAVLDPIRLVRMVNEVEWLIKKSENRHDPIHLAWMVKKAVRLWSNGRVS